DLIVTIGNAAPLAAARATREIPIVMMGNTGDPVASGLVQSVARPGGNVTGVLGNSPDLDMKRLQLLVEAAPSVNRVLVLQATPPRVSADQWDTATKSLGI